MNELDEGGRISMHVLLIDLSEGKRESRDSLVKCIVRDQKQEFSLLEMV